MKMRELKKYSDHMMDKEPKMPKKEMKDSGKKKDTHTFAKFIKRKKG